MAIRCTYCNRSTDKSRPPKGWKTLGGGQYVCKECWRERYVMRAVTFPLAGPVDGEWADLRVDLRACWARSTSLANWATTELAKADVIRTSDMDRMPKMPAVYLYGLAARGYADWPQWSGSYAAAQSLLRTIEGKYRKRRLEVIWRHDASLPSHRYPYPYPVHNENWRPSFIETEGANGQKSRVPVVKVKLNGRDWTLRLSGGYGHRRQLAAFRQIIDHPETRGELAIYRISASTGDHRNGVADRANGGGKKRQFRVMVKLAAWMPRKGTAEGRTGTLEVRSGTHAFLIAIREGADRAWTLYDDQVKRWIKNHRWQLERMSDDRKAERRRPKRRRLQANDRLADMARRYQNRMDSYCHRASAMLVQYADRYAIREIRYDDSERKYAPEFPWARLKELVAQKADDRGIEFTDASAMVINEKD